MDAGSGGRKHFGERQFCAAAVMQPGGELRRRLELAVMGEPGPDRRARLRQRGLTRGQVADWHETVALTPEDVRWAVIAKLTAGPLHFRPGLGPLTPRAHSMRRPISLAPPKPT